MLHIVGGCFCNIVSIENVDSLLGAEDYGKGEPAPLIMSYRVESQYICDSCPSYVPRVHSTVVQ